VRNFGLIGYPLSHSFSRKYFGDKFRREHITDCTYELYPLPSLDGFRELVSGLPGMEGLNVTIPYKQKIIALIDELDQAARAIGAVNTLLFRDGSITGYNTDVVGFERSLVPLLESHHTAALVLGTGGASKAVAFALRRLGIPSRFVSRQQRDPAHLTYQELDESILKRAPLIINTTPVGTSPNVDDAPDIPYEFIGPGHLLYDLVYNPAETQFLKRGRACGAATKNGYEMLELQADASWEIWNR
jgi:shikimate dehydrogenase